VSDADRERIAYRRGYKYVLAGEYSTLLHFSLPAAVVHRWFTISACGVIWIADGYAWDGPSGPTFDTPDSMRGSLIHDVLYQAMSEGLLSTAYRPHADLELELVCLEDDMPAVRARAWRTAVQAFGERPAVTPRQILYAPR